MVSFQMEDHFHLQIQKLPEQIFDPKDTPLFQGLQEHFYLNESLEVNSFSLKGLPYFYRATQLTDIMPTLLVTMDKLHNASASSSVK